MKILIASILFVSALIFSRQCHADPKVTQAASVDFVTNKGLVALAIEEPEKNQTLSIYRNEKEIFSTKFDKLGASPYQFGYTNPFLRFKTFDIEGFGQPILIAIAAHPGGSDETCEVKLVAEK
ncbi:MAG TPA: hypothetical protein VGK71_02570 [Nitrospirota bacterium]|jgi:hypothetical protein